MKVTEHKGGQLGRAVLASLIEDTAVLGAVAGQWDGKLMGDATSNRIAGWCVDHLRKYGKAPGPGGIREYAFTFAEGGGNKDDLSMIDKLLSDLSSELGRNGHSPNSEFRKEQAAKHITLARYRDLHDRMGPALEHNDQEALDKAFQEFRRVEIGAVAGIHPTAPGVDLSGVIGGRKSRCIVNYEGAAGEFFAHMLERDAFIAFVGVEKGYKSFWQLDVAWRAYRSGLKVVWVIVGDMSQDQVMRRVVARAANRPVMATTHSRRPREIEPGGTGVEFKDRSFPEPMTEDEAKTALEKAAGRNDPDNLWLTVHPRGSLSASGLASMVKEKMREGWGPPDVIVCDYSDNLAPENSKVSEKRHQIDDTWGTLSGLRQELHCLLVTGTQATRVKKERKHLTRDDVSESKTKTAHVTGMVGITQGPNSGPGVLGLNWIAARDLDFEEEKVCYCASHLDVANPCVRSTF